MPFLSTIIAADIVSGEYSKGTFRLYLSRPISRSKILLSKLIIVYLYTILLMAFFIGYSLLDKCSLVGDRRTCCFSYGFVISIKRRSVNSIFYCVFNLYSSYVNRVFSMLLYINYFKEQRHSHYYYH